MNTTNLLGSDVEINGTLILKQDCTVDGMLKGSISSEGLVVVGENGNIEADIIARSVCIMGRVTGNVSVQDKCELRPNGVLVGDVKAPRMIIEEGATFVGRSDVRPQAESEFKSELANGKLRRSL